jgi:hypothetical protein
MTLRRVSAGAMADVARLKKSAASDGLGCFSDNHAVHRDEVTRLQVDES